jgi:hypothetical protein
MVASSQVEMMVNSATMRVHPIRMDFFGNHLHRLGFATEPSQPRRDSCYHQRWE